MSLAVYWCSFFLVFYSYFGYWLWLAVSARKRPVQTAAIEPTVSVIIAARNEAARLPAKLANLKALRYPQHLLQYIVVSDGSTDGTAEILRQHPEVHSILLETSGGKARALNRAVEEATGDLLLFLDVRQRLEPDALEKLAQAFADPGVGAVSGELVLETQDGAAAADMLGLYWKIEKSVRRLEGESGSVVGVTGAIYLMRRELFQALPAGLILDDVLVPMQVVRQGKRVLFQPAAIARDYIFPEPGKEFSRKVRTLTGNLQLVQLAPWLLSPRNPILFRFLSHKLLRLAVPFLLIVMMVAAALSASMTLHLLLAAQLVFLGLALLGRLFPASRRSKLVSIPWTFTMLNVAAACAFYKFVSRHDVWA